MIWLYDLFHCQNFMSFLLIFDNEKTPSLKQKKSSTDSSFQEGKQDSNMLFKGRGLLVIHGLHE